jgi:hypothetical protein
MTRHRAADVIDHAEATALYFRTLVGEGVEVASAIQMTCSYVYALAVAANVSKPPLNPWDGPPDD